LDAAARVLRALHDAIQVSDLRGSSEVVCHGDVSPCNAVFRDGLPYAWIDFDAASPGTNTVLRPLRFPCRRCWMRRRGS
jgi:Ser/Thr protein kinase RdoA (MazF antagonist)